MCDIWNNLSNPSVKEVHKNCGYNIASVRRWLKIGAKINLCNYDPKKEMVKNAKIPHHGKSVICLNYMKTFKSLKDAAKYYNINHVKIEIILVAKILKVVNRYFGCIMKIT